MMPVPIKSLGIAHVTNEISNRINLTSHKRDYDVTDILQILHVDHMILIDPI